MKEKISELINQYKPLSIKKIENNNPGFLKKETYEIKLKNGEKIIREKLLKGKDCNGAVIIVPITKDGNILLVVQPRVFNSNHVGVEVPAGYIDGDEEPLKAAQRELSEETGYTTSKKFIFLGKYIQDQGCNGNYNYGFLAYDCIKTTTQHLDKDEFITFIECPIEEVTELIKDGTICDLNSIYILEHAITEYKKIKGKNV